MKRLFIFSGEHSGDMHGAALVSSLRSALPQLHVEGVAGPCLRKEGIDVFMNMEEFAVMGFTDVLKALPRLYSRFRKIRAHILKSNPEIVVLVDYQDFNLQLARSLRKGGYRGKLIQYISPTVWAWRAGRAKALANYFDALFTIFPFEPKYYSHTPLKALYIGNPTKEHIRSHSYDSSWKSALGLPNSPLVALFPGSRRSELSHNLPLHLKAAEALYAIDNSLSFALSCTSEHLLPFILGACKKCSLIEGKNLFIVPRDYSYELMRDSTLALAKSGTVTLELALHQTPTVVTYKISKMQQFIAKQLLRIRLPFYCIANILANREIYPEFIGASLNENTIALTLDSMRKNRRNELAASCSEVNRLLTDASPGPTAAAFIQEMLQQ